MLFWRLRDLRIYSHAAIGIAVLALLGVDATVAGVRSGDAAQVVSMGGHHASQPVGRAGAVTGGRGKIWALVALGRGPKYHLRVIDPQTEQVVHSVLLAGRLSHLFYGAGRVWAVGGQRISAVDPVTLRVASL